MDIMSKITLTYFDIKGNRGQTARLALELAGKHYIDDRISFEEFRAMKPSFPFGSVPILQVDEHLFSQSNAINRYVGKTCDLYPSDPLQAAFCDEVMDGVEDIGNCIAPTMRIKDKEQLKATRAALSETSIPRYLKGLAKCLKRGGGKHYADNKLTIADLKSFVLVRWLIGGILDHIPSDVVKKSAPSLIAHHDMVFKIPKIMKHYS